MLPVQYFSPSILIGCSGWQYRHWRGDFYPASLPQNRWFDHYAERFNSVEINNTFYRLPEPTTFGVWGKRAPAGFKYAVKASRYLTHMKKLKDPDEPVELFFSRAKRLGRSLGAVLYQLPPRWPVNIERLDTFLKALPGRRRHAIEFRDPSWYRDDVFSMLEERKVALCLHDMKGSATGRLPVGPFAYVRFHGPQKYTGRYPDAVLDEWADWLAARVHAGVAICAYFNNDNGGHAPRDAVRLRDRIAARLGHKQQDYNVGHAGR